MPLHSAPTPRHTQGGGRTHRNHQQVAAVRGIWAQVMAELPSVLTESPLKAGFRLGTTVVFPLRLRVERAGTSDRLEPQIAGVLLVLAERALETVTREELFQRVWGGRFVSEDVLHRAVSRLRGLLGDDPRSPLCIETIPKVGYRLLLTPLPLEPELPNQSEPMGPPVADQPTAGRRSPLPIAAALATLTLGLWWFARGAEPAKEAAPAHDQRPRPAIALPGTELQPALSADGRELLFSWTGSAGTRQIYRTDLLGSPPRRVSGSAEREEAPAWLGSNAVVYARLSADDCRLVEQDLDTGGERDLALCSHRARIQLDAAAKGEVVVWTDLAGEPETRHAIRILEVGPRNLRWLTQPPDGLEDQHPRLSPDGLWVAFARGVPGTAAQLMLVATTGAEPDVQPTLVSQEPCLVHGLDWLDNGRLAVARACRGEEPGIWELTLDGEHRPLDLGGDRRAPCAAAGIIAYESWRQQANIVVTGLESTTSTTQAEQALAPSSRLDHSPTLSPDATEVAFVSDRTGSPEIWRVRLDGTQLERVTDSRGVHVSRPAWSPDARTLAFTTWTPEAGEVCLVPVRGGARRCLENSGGHDVVPVFDEAGRVVYFGSDRDGGRWRIWRWDLASERAEPLTGRGIWPVATVAGALYFLDFRRDGLYRRDPNGAEVAVLPDVPYSLASNVAVTASGITFARTDGSVVSCDLAGGNCETIGHLEGLDFRSGLRLQGDVAVYSRHTPAEVEVLVRTVAPGNGDA